MGVMTGLIQRIATDRETGKRKGFGFIRASGGQDYFFHATDAGGSRQFNGLFENDRVEFEAMDGPKGLRAVNVRKVG